MLRSLRISPLIIAPAIVLIIASLALTGFALAQADPQIDCTPEGLAQQINTLQAVLPTDFDANPDIALANLFRLANLYQEIAIDCGYVPSEIEVNALIINALAVADLPTIIAANAVGDDVDEILLQLADVRGDAFNGQLLYNGIEPALDGTALGCSGCHMGEAAPPTEGIWTRTDEIRLNDPALAGYDDLRYLVESVVQPNEYIVPDYVANLMPSNYGQRLDIQQLADLIAFMMSQDQLLDE